MRFRWAAVSNKRKIEVVEVALIVLLCGIAYAGGLLAHAPTLTRIEHVVRAPSSGSALVAAWGKPDQSIDGAQVNSSLKGATCVIYQSRRAMVCYAP